MTQSIIVLSGPISSGKTTLAELLAKRYKMKTVKTKTLLTKSLGDKKPLDRISLQRAGEKLDRKTNGRWVVDTFTPVFLDSAGDTTFVIDSTRIPEQVESIRAAFPSVTHVHLTARPAILEQRYNGRTKIEKGMPTYSEAKKIQPSRI